MSGDSMNVSDHFTESAFSIVQGFRDKKISKLNWKVGKINGLIMSLPKLKNQLKVGACVMYVITKDGDGAHVIAMSGGLAIPRPNVDDLRRIHAIAAGTGVKIPFRCVDEIQTR